LLNLKNQSIYKTTANHKQVKMSKNSIIDTQENLTIEEIEELELLNEKYVVGDKTIENLTIALRIKELTDNCDNTER